MSRHRSCWQVPDPWPARIRQTWCRLVWCRLFGHDVIVKMDGTRLCRRH